MNEIFDARTASLDPGVVLLEASAGTGKTWSLTAIAVRLIVEGRVAGIERLLLVTFTRAATDEMRQRLRARLDLAERALRGESTGDEFLDEFAIGWNGDAGALRRVRNARRDIDLARVRTIHSFCLEVLSEGAFEAGLALERPEPAEGSTLLLTALRDTVRALAHDPRPFVGAFVHRLGLDPDDRVTAAALERARRRAADPWRPEAADLDHLLEALRSAVEAIDPASLAAFVDAGTPKDWRTPDRNTSLRAMRRLARGIDVGEILDQAAVLDLVPPVLGKNLTKKGNERFADSDLSSALAPLEELAPAIGIALTQFACRESLRRYAELKESLGLTDYDDIISSTRGRLADPGTGPELVRRIAGQFDAALVDEFQDTDADQWEIFRTLFSVEPPAPPRHLLLLVGDPKQAIYRFRGADIYAYLAARGRADRSATLHRNFRASRALVDAVNRVFGERPAESFALAGIEFDPVTAAAGEPDADRTPLEFVWVDVEDAGSQDRVTSAVLDRLARDVVRRRQELRGPADIAVLVRRHTQARQVVRALRAVGVDAVLARGGDVHASEAMVELRIILRALLDPARLPLQRRARATRIWGSRASDLGSEGTGRDDVERFERLRRLWSGTGVATMVSALISGCGTIGRWLGEEDGERMVTDLRHGLELLVRAEASRSLSPEALLRWAEAQVLDEEGAQAEERQLRLDRESEAVQVLTGFASKGLEYDTVLLPFAWTGTAARGQQPRELHDPDTGAAILDFAGDARFDAQYELEEFASALRMHYVELTRARRRCVVYLAPYSGLARSAAAYLMARSPGAPAPDERAGWLQEQLAALKASLDEAPGRIRARAASAGSIGFRAAKAAGTAAADWPRPEIFVPGALEFPASRRAALVPAPRLSYTALVHGLHERGDVDPAAADLPVADRSDPADAPASRGAKGIFGFARGARAGICLHELLEHADFSAPGDESDAARVAALLARHGLARREAHPGDIDPVAVALALVDQVRAERTPLGSDRFARLDKTARLDEWAFQVPVVDLVPRRLAQLVREHWADEEWTDLAAARMERLPAGRLKGMLAGSVDLFFVEDGRWTVLDWKSNDLGPTADHYDADSMRRAMVEHDYLVQALFYTLAAHRFLRTRILGYDYEREFAGVSYAFLRGLCGNPARGWCNLRPPHALIEALDAIFAGGPPR